MPQTKPLPQRTCAACYKKAQKSEFIRIIRTPKKILKIAQSPNEPGRGLYLCPNSTCLEKALKHKGKNAFQHHLKISPSPEFIQKLLSVIPDGTSSPHCHS